MSKSCTIIAVANQKGGVGKSSTCVNLGHALAKSGHKVLLVDFDPQGNLTMSFGVELPDELPLSMFDVLTSLIDTGKALPKEDYILTGDMLDIIPSNIKLSASEVNLRYELGGESTLSELLEPLRSGYDYIIIDSSPFLGMLTSNVLTACDKVIIPVSPELWSARGLTDLILTINKIRSKLNPRIELAGILLTMCDERTNLYKEFSSLLADTYGESLKIFDTTIPRSVKVGEANYASMSVVDFEPTNKAAKAYISFAEEIMHHVET